MSLSREPLFEEVCSKDFLEFKFGGRSYQDQLYDSIAKTGVLAGVKVERLVVTTGGASLDIVWVTHNFGFLGGSLGCAEGEKLTRAFEYAVENNLPICVQCRSGGARMQEGTSSLMQMAKVSVAVQALHEKGLPFITVLADPTYGGVSASYAMQSDIKIAVTSSARIGFAGPAVILNTMCEANQKLFDERCPPDFQAASYVYDNGQIDIVLDDDESSQEKIESTVATISSILLRTKSTTAPSGSVFTATSNTGYQFNYTNSRAMDRPQTQDIIHQCFENFTELSGDGKVGRDACLKGGIAMFQGTPCVIISTSKGHTPTDMQNANYGMPSPHGYRTALRLMKLAEKFNMPVITFVDTVGAWPTFQCERDGQSEAIATNLTAMAGLKVPMITLMVGEGGSGGALGICMGNTIGMLSGGYFGVISPEGAASILGRYKDDKHKADQFPKDCQELATAQCIYAHQLKDLGVVDQILWEDEGTGKETYKSFPNLKSKIMCFISDSLKTLQIKTVDDLIKSRYDKYRALGTFSLLDDAQRKALVIEAKEKSTKKPQVKKNTNKRDFTSLFEHLSNEIIAGNLSKHQKKAPPCVQSAKGLITPTVNFPWNPTQKTVINERENAKSVLDKFGPEKLSKWIIDTSKGRVLLTDTTMRDAHQSLLATRVRTIDLLKGAEMASDLLEDAFSLEMWGGATFDVCMRFLDEDPWERLRKLRAACPNVCFQMLIRGANAVGYTSYADNVVAEFVRLAALNGMDVFRIFDCFNIVENMMVSIKAVIAAKKVAEVCICYTGNLLTSNIYTLDYYKDLAKEIKSTGAHIIGIKDMAGLLRPLEVEPLMNALREAVGYEMPIHFHTHATSSGSLATCMEMARCGCNIIDFATASMADGTSQPSLNAFIAMMEGSPRATGLKFLDLEPYDMYWAKVRDMYSPFESGMKSGSARVFDHQIPGGQYSNLFVQCQSMGLYEGDQWGKVLDTYRDVNMLFGDIVKVTPSSKCVGDLALYLVVQGITTEDLLSGKAGSIDFPDSVVGLLKGDLGFPHRGFPKEIEDMILKKGSIIKNSKRAGILLPSVDFEENRKKLSAEFGCPISEEHGMSSLMYPKVFSDYMKRTVSKGPLLRYLPTPVYFYSLQCGDSFEIRIPSNFIDEVLCDEAMIEKIKPLGAKITTLTVELLRVSALQKQKRAVQFRVKHSHGEESQTVHVRDTGGVFIFEGEMADSALVAAQKQSASPMPGTVEKILVKEGQSVKSGDVLCVISAMKMEVKVSAPCDCKISSVVIPTVGYRVVEGALLFNILK